MNIKLLYIDLFCGAGGTTTGVELATLHGEKCAKVIACVNHDANAIASHLANHPGTVHFTEDIRTLDLSPLAKIAEEARRQYPAAKLVLWASLECTNFSRAKGGQPRDADSRTLAEHLFRYIEALKPDYIQIENVEEFMCWGALDENGKPVSRHKGSSYLQWVNHVLRYGYNYDWRLLNAADFGAYTSRKRFFGQFARRGLYTAFPTPTFSKDGDNGGIFKTYHRWRPVREVLDLQDEGENIFLKKKPLCEKTLDRIYAGLVKFVAGGKDKCDAWLLKYNSTNQKNNIHHPPSIDLPCPTVATQNRLGVFKCQFLSKQFSGHPMSKNQSLDKPAGTVTAVDHHAFVTAYYGNGFNSDTDKPAPTIPTKDRLALVTTRFLDSQYGNGKPTSIETPAPTVVNNPKQSLVSTHYLMNPQFASAGGSIDKPCFTLIARMDKMPPYLISTEQGIGINIYDDDSPMTRKIKLFMAAYGIVDIKMRMLKVSELLAIQGFPADYKLVGTQSEQKKFIGNAVEVNQSRALCEALAERVAV